MADSAIDYDNDTTHTAGPDFILALSVIPSSYALITWLVTLAMIPLSPQSINSLSINSIFVISYTILFFILSIIINLKFADNQ